MKHFFIIFVALMASLALACSGDKSSLNFDFNTQAGAAVPYPDVNFVVISDTHIYDASLGSSGAAFEKTMNSDRKLLLESIELMDFASEIIVNSGASFVLIAGDLTKDGELINHRIMAEKLKVFSDAGIATYVVPGNHDINNSHAFKYDGDKTELVATVNAADFAQIYADFGFNSALMRDGDSLSYVAEPVEGLWLLALDTCRYRENQSGHEPLVGGKISQRTADWIATVLRAANSQNKAVMAMMHHGVVEHWKGQSKLHPDYIVNDFVNFGKFLASWNVRLAFTGHYHAQDVVRSQFDDKFIYDIETGSLITAPCPIRYVEIKNNVANIRSDTIVERLRPGTNFAAEAQAFVKKTVSLEAASVLRKYKVSVKDADYIADAVGDAFNAHYSGDEDPSLRPFLDTKKLSPWGRFIYSQQKYALDGLWTDLPPKDNNVQIEL